jgi:hypothetical protein
MFKRQGFVFAHLKLSFVHKLQHLQEVFETKTYLKGTKESETIPINKTKFKSRNQVALLNGKP